MSFLFDLPALIVIGILLYIFGNHYDLRRLSKITIGILIVSSFIIFSLMLYFDKFSFNFPANGLFPANGFNMSGSQFMFQWPFNTGFTKESVPSLAVIFLFLLYPVMIYLGYAGTLLVFKGHKRKIMDEPRTYKHVKSRRPAETPKYSIAREQNACSAVNKAIIGLYPDGIRKFVKENNRVLIKVNICGGVPDNVGSFTSQEVVGCLIDLIAKEVGGNSIIICDADMIWTKFWENAKEIKWDEWVDKKNRELEELSRNGTGKSPCRVELVNLSETTLAYFDFGEGSVFNGEKGKNFDIVSDEMLNADVIISIPKMKTHLLTEVTLGMKNMYGTFPDEDKARYHLMEINKVIYWINNAFPPNLTIIDGIIGGENIGPLSVDKIEGYNTIVCSNSAPIADAIASMLIGYEDTSKDPFDEIDYLRFTRCEELKKPENERFLLKGDPKELIDNFKELINNLQRHPKDGNWARPNEEVCESYEFMMENILTLPGMATFFNIGADFLLFDLARIPILKYFNEAILKFLYDAPRFWTQRKSSETNLARRDRWISYIVFSLVSILSMYFFYSRNYLSASLSNIGNSQWIILGVLLSLILFFVFSLVLKMRTKSFSGIVLASMLVALFVESFAPLAKWWKYLHEGSGVFQYSGLSFPSVPAYPLFSIPIFIIIIIGISYFILKPFFAYVGLEGERFKLVPFGVIMVPLLSLLFLEGYLSNISLNSVPTIIAIYLVLGFLGLSYNQKHHIEWNLSIAITAVVLGGAMEYLGWIAGFWSYPNHSNFPLFVSLTWALNTWAACGLAQVFGIDMDQAFTFISVNNKNGWQTNKGKEVALKDSAEAEKNLV